MLRAHSIVTGMSLLILACGSKSSDRQEDINKLRALGVSVCSGPQPSTAATCTKLVGTPSTASAPQQFTLTIYAALPLGVQVDTAEPFADTKSTLGQTAALTVVSGSGKYEDHQALRLYSVQATALIPVGEALPIPPSPGFTRLRYGVRLVAGGREEKLVGNLLVYPAGDPALAWSAPTLAVTSPTASAAVSGTVDLQATVASPSGENLRVAWFADDGAIDNRRAKSTTWKAPASGNHTVFATVRGLSSGGFAIKAIDVKVP